MSRPPEEVFVDTSIQVARFVHSPETKQRIRNRLELYGSVSTGLVVRQEFKRRLLKEAKYLLELLERCGSFSKVMRHLVDYLPPQWHRKQKICLEALTTIDEQDSDEDRTERLGLFLRGLLRDGLGDFDASVNRLRRGSGCACAEQPVRRRPGKRERYELGPDRCTEAGTACPVGEFLSKLSGRAQAILDRLKALPAERKTKELVAAEEFLRRRLVDTARASDDDPCLTVGDLLIALESAGVPAFYTLNRKESEHLCPALGQVLIVRPVNAAHDDEVIAPDTRGSA
jgi:hypothetical protein